MAANWDLGAVSAAFSEASFGGADWSSALEVANNHLGTSGAAIVPLKGAFSGLPTTKCFEEAIDAYIRDGWVDRDIRFSGVSTMRRAGVATDLDIMTPEAISKHPYYQEWLRPFGLKWFAGVHVTSGDDEWALSIQHSEAHGPFGRDEIQKLKILSRGISSSVAVASALDFTRAETALGAFEKSRKAAMVLNRHGQVVLMNGAVDRVVGPDLQICNRRIVFRDSVARRTFDAAIHAVCSAATGSGMLPPIKVPRINAGPIIAYVTPARGVARDVFSRCQAFVVLVDPWDRVVPTPEMLQQIFALTPTEARLAHWLAKGHKLHELAESGGFSYETGRNHLKTIFAKIGVNNQSDLIATLLSMAAPLGFF